MYEKGDIKRYEVVRVTGNLKCEEVSGIDGRTTEILKGEGKTVIDWMHVV